MERTQIYRALKKGFRGRDPIDLPELEDLLVCDDLAALICVRGGYGAMRLLDAVDLLAERRLAQRTISRPEESMKVTPERSMTMPRSFMRPTTSRRMSAI